MLVESGSWPTGYLPALPVDSLGQKELALVGFFQVYMHYKDPAAEHIHGALLHRHWGLAEHNFLEFESVPELAAHRSVTEHNSLAFDLIQDSREDF
jgi:hypothetical protein